MLIVKGFDEDVGEGLGDHLMDVFNVEDDDDAYKKLVPENPEAEKFPSLFKVGVPEDNMYETKISCTDDQKTSLYNCVIEHVSRLKNRGKYSSPSVTIF